MGAPVDRRVVITGVGMVNPLGIGLDAVWTGLLGGASAIGPIRRFDPAGLPVSLAAEIPQFDPLAFVPRRLAVKSDRFAHYALAATDLALRDAGLDLAAEDPFRVGISFGNNSGGWDIVQRGFDEYYGQGPPMVNPWQATAWFPAAPQGFVSIRHGIRGFSKSFAADRASGSCALYFALRSIRWDHTDVVLAGGSEAPLTRLGVAAHVATGEVTRATDPSSAYRPFAPGRRGLVLGEGSTVLVLEELSHAVRRGARILGELLAVEQRTGAPSDPTSSQRATLAALAAADRVPDDVDLLLPEAVGTVQGDATEEEAVRRVFAQDGGALPPAAAPKAAYGHLYGASGATEVAVALAALRDRLVPPTVGASAGSGDMRLSDRPLSADLDLALVNATSREGTAVATLVVRYGVG